MRKVNHADILPKLGQKDFLTEIFDAVYNFLDPGEEGENMVLCSSKTVNENENRRGKRILKPIEACFNSCTLKKKF